MKKVLLLLSGLSFLVAGWYLFLKPSDYIIRFKVKAIPGTINQTLKA